MVSSTKPKLAQLKTPVSSTYPSELSALSARTPLAGFADIIKQEDTKTPITPPTAYTDFLKALTSPALGDKASGRASPTSAPSIVSTESTESTKSTCNCDSIKSPASTVPPTPSFRPSTARSTSWLGRLRIPPSPAFSSSESPMSAPLTASSAVMSPFSARSSRGARSPYDWSCASKARYPDIKSPKSAGGPNVRHVREIVTRTVRYTPRMSPAPKGKRRKIE